MRTRTRISRFFLRTARIAAGVAVCLVIVAGLSIAYAQRGDYRVYPRLRSPLACESTGVAVEGGTRLSTKASDAHMNYEHVVRDSRAAYDGMVSFATREGLHCDDPCTLTFVYRSDEHSSDWTLEPDVYGNSTRPSGPQSDQARWYIDYACKKPIVPPTQINQTMPQGAGGGGGSSSAGLDRSAQPSDLSIVTARCERCEEHATHLHELGAEADQAERDGRDIASQIEAARSRGDTAGADALAPQAAANDRQQRNIRSSIDLEWTLLKNCEKQYCPEPANMTAPPPDNGNGKKSFFDSIFGGVSIGVGVGGSAPHRSGEGRGRDQPPPQQPPPQPPPPQQPSPQGQ